MTLTNMVQVIGRMTQKLEVVAPGIAEKLGWIAPGRDPWWTPPAMETTWSRNVAGLVWVLAAISRLAAHHKLSPDEFDRQLKNLLCVEDGFSRTSRTVQNRICILLSFAPELFAFLVALFELRFPVEPKK